MRRTRGGAADWRGQGDWRDGWPMHRVLTAFWILVFSALLCGGCDASGGASRVLEAQNPPYVRDVPTPRGFVLKHRESEHYASETRRQIRHLYEGPADLNAVKSFYIRSMTASGWEFIDDSLRNAAHILKYGKGEETCEIRIERTPAGLFGEVTKIRVQVRKRNGE